MTAVTSCFQFMSRVVLLLLSESCLPNVNINAVTSALWNTGGCYRFHIILVNLFNTPRRRLNVCFAHPKLWKVEKSLRAVLVPDFELHSLCSCTEGRTPSSAIVREVGRCPSVSRSPSSRVSILGPLQFGSYSLPREISSLQYSVFIQSACRKVKMTRAAFCSLLRFLKSSITGHSRPF